MATPAGSLASTSESPPALLVVDDEPELRGLLNEYFVRHGFRVVEAPDAASAREAIALGRPQLALLDVNMPGESGLSLARWLREAHPEVAIVMLTTVGDSVDRIVGLEMGADDYVPKPFELRELLARVRAVLRRSQGAGGSPARARGRHGRVAAGRARLAARCGGTGRPARRVRNPHARPGTPPALRQ